MKLFQAIRRHFKEVMERPRWKNPADGIGGFFDVETHRGNIRSIIMFLLFIYGGQHLDSLLYWLWDLCDAEQTYPSAFYVARHANMALVMGGAGVFWSVLLLFHSLKTYRRRQAQEAQIDREIADRLAAMARAGKPVFPPTREERIRRVLRRWPILHGLLWGWPFVMALPLIWCADHISALSGIMLGAMVYLITHALSKRQGKLWSSLAFSFCIGVAAVCLWGHFAPVMTGGPVPDVRFERKDPAALQGNAQH